MPATSATQHLGHGLGHACNVAVVEAGHADAARADSVDTELFAQTVHLGGRQAGVTEHAVLAQQEGKVLVRDRALELRGQLDAHVAHPYPHLLDFGTPLRGQLVVAQHMRHQQRTIARRAGIVATHGQFQLAQHIGRLACLRAEHRQRTDALAVEREDFGEGIGEEERNLPTHRLAHRPDVFVQALGEALVGQVEEGQQTALFEHIDDLFPLRAGRIDAGRIVTAGVQQHHRALGQGIQLGQHALEVQALGLRIVVGVTLGLEAGAFEDADVVVPGRVRQPDGGLREEARDQVGTHLECTRAAQGLHDGQMFRRGQIRTEEQLGHRLAIGGMAFHGQIDVGRAGFGHCRGSGAHRGQHRHHATAIGIDADGKVDLVAALVALELFHQAQDGIAGIRREMRKHEDLVRLRNADAGAAELYRQNRHGSAARGKFPALRWRDRRFTGLSSGTGSRRCGLNATFCARRTARTRPAHGTNRRCMRKCRSSARAQPSCLFVNRQTLRWRGSNSLPIEGIPP
ncbi:WbpN [Herbaspirillum frisingense GSF30]|uniref:WbpN n=1 Tax=Herbaspirillum frisingense GSF30 TaxID=864073 RepID=A0AAI9IJ43_9BURK|nr:WbpN [Herbaspirillum frisingense GSF30]